MKILNRENIFALIVIIIIMTIKQKQINIKITKVVKIIERIKEFFSTQTNVFKWFLSIKTIRENEFFIVMRFNFDR